MPNTPKTMKVFSTGGPTYHPGARIGNLTLIDRVELGKSGSSWNVQCDCGKVTVRKYSYLCAATRGMIDNPSCGCMGNERKRP